LYGDDTGGSFDQVIDDDVGIADRRRRIPVMDDIGDEGGGVVVVMSDSCRLGVGRTISDVGIADGFLVFVGDLTDFLRVVETSFGELFDVALRLDGDFAVASTDVFVHIVGILELSCDPANIFCRDRDKGDLGLA